MATVAPAQSPATTLTKRTGAVGRCKWFHTGRGYGFLTVVDGLDNHLTDVFVHHTAIRVDNTGGPSSTPPDGIVSPSRGSLTLGEYVQFDVVQGHERDAQAANVTGLFGGPLLCQSRRQRREHPVREGLLPPWEPPQPLPPPPPPPPFGGVPLGVGGHRPNYPQPPPFNPIALQPPPPSPPPPPPPLGG